MEICQLAGLLSRLQAIDGVANENDETPAHFGGAGTPEVSPYVAKRQAMSVTAVQWSRQYLGLEVRARNSSSTGEMCAGLKGGEG